MSAARKIVRLLLLSLVLGSSALPAARAGEAAPLAADEVVEKRMVRISGELRCLVCQNESLAGSRAALAEDLRREIRNLIRQDKSDEEIMDFMVSRYGDFVRYRPPFNTTTLLLWLGPFLLLIGAIAGLIIYLRHRHGHIAQDAPPLSTAERQRAEALLKNTADTRDSANTGGGA